MFHPKKASETSEGRLIRSLYRHLHDVVHCDVLLFCRLEAKGSIRAHVMQLSTLLEPYGMTRSPRAQSPLANQLSAAKEDL